MKISTLDLCILILYFIGIMALGLSLSKRNVNTKAYFLGGQSFSGWIIGMSLIATMISSLTFIAGPADSFKTAYLRSVTSFGLPIAAVIMAIWLVPIFRNSVTTAYEYLDKRYGPSVSIYAASIFLLVQVVRISMVAYLVAILFQHMTGLNFAICLLLTAGCTGVYSSVGGFTAVVWTDVIQTVILTLGAVLCVYVVVHALPGGITQLFSQAWEYKKLSFWDINPVSGILEPTQWGLTLSEKSVTVMFIAGACVSLSNNTDQNSVQRWCSTKTTRDARISILMLGAGSIVIWLTFKFVGTALFVYFKQFPNPVPQEILDGTRKAEEIMPFFIINNLPPGVSGIVIAAAMAAAMSTLSSVISSSSMVAVHDFYKRFLVKGEQDRHYLKMGKLASWTMTAIMIVGAYTVYFLSTNTLADLFMVVTSILGSTMGAIILLGTFTKRTNSPGLWGGIVIGTGFMAYALLGQAGILPEGMQLPLYIYYAGPLCNLIVFASAYLISRLIKGRQADIRDLTIWSQKSTD